MCGYGAESAATKTPAMQIYGEFYHLVCRDAFAFVLRMRCALVRQVERFVYLFCCHGRIRRVHHDKFPVCFLQQPAGMNLIGLFFYMAKILRFRLFIGKTFVM